MGRKNGIAIGSRKGGMPRIPGENLSVKPPLEGFETASKRAVSGLYDERFVRPAACLAGIFFSPPERLAP
ncbi:MAG: hypothetical protein GY801_46950 [bacterium]|nr:hypothetical protein [bacterium]